MKHCSKCNAEIQNDAAAYCPMCGAPQPEPQMPPQTPPQASAYTPPAQNNSPPAGAPVQQTPPSQMPPYGQPSWQGGYAPPVPPYGGAPGAAPMGYQPPATERVCGAGFSVLLNALQSRGFLAMTICYTAAVVLNIAGIVFGPGISDLMYSFGIAAGSASTDMIYRLFLVAAQCTAGLLCVGLWMCRKAAVDAAHVGVLSLQGFKLIRISMHISFAVSVVLVVVLGIGGVLLSMVGNTPGYTYSEGLQIVGISVLLGCVIGFVVTFILYRKTIKTIKAITYTAQTGYPTLYVSMFLIVIYMLQGVSSVFSCLSLGVALFNWQDVLLLVSSVLLAAFYILVGFGLQKYRQKMQGIVANAYRGML